MSKPAEPSEHATPDDVHRMVSEVPTFAMMLCSGPECGYAALVPEDTAIVCPVCKKPTLTGPFARYDRRAEKRAPPGLRLV